MNSENLELIYRSFQLSHVLGGGFVVLIGMLYLIDIRLGKSKRWGSIIELHQDRSSNAIAVCLLIISITWGLTGLLGFWSRLIDGMVVWLQSVNGSVTFTSTLAMLSFYLLGAMLFATLTQAYKRSAKTFGILLTGSFASTWLGVL